MDCIFCKIISGEIPSYKIYEDEYVLAILDINPIAKGHVLVLPKKHFDIFENTENIYLEKMIDISKKLGKELREKLGSDGFNVLVNNDKVAGQLVFHTHFHIIQRFTDDKLEIWELNKTEQQQLQETFNTLQAE